jgi:hypothetical protein
MKTKEIQDRNKQIALMLGAFTKEMMGINAWVLQEDELNLSFDRFDEKIFSNNGGSSWKIKDLKFHSDWNWLHEAIDFILKTNQTIISLNNCEIYMYKNGQKPINIGAKNTKLATFIAVSDFAKLYNNKEL